MTDKLCLAIVEAGGFAETCHIPGVQSHPKAQIVALYRRDRELGLQMAQKIGVPKVYTDATALIVDDEIDGITIATPNVFHHPVAIDAVVASVKQRQRVDVKFPR